MKILDWFIQYVILPAVIFGWLLGLAAFVAYNNNGPGHPNHGKSERRVIRIP